MLYDLGDTGFRQIFSVSLYKSLGLMLFLVFGISVRSSAQSCCSGGVPAGTHLGFVRSSEGALKVNLLYRSVLSRALFSGSEHLEDRLRKRTTQSYLLRLGYAVGKHWEAEFHLPFIWQTRTIYTNAGGMDFELSRGLGDPFVLLTYAFGAVGVDAQAASRPSMGGGLVWRLGGGLQMPLGRTDLRNAQGLFFVEDMQPGSGSWDVLFFSSVYFSPGWRRSMSVYAYGVYTLNGVNRQARGGSFSYTFGDDFQAVFLLTDQFLLGSELFFPTLGFWFRALSPDLVNENIPVAGTGGYFLFLRGGLSWAMPGKWGSLGAVVELPVYRYVHETQLTPSLAFNLSWTHAFSKLK